MRKCTKLISHTHWNSSFVGSCCKQWQAPPNKTHHNNDKTTHFKILQFNCRGIQNKIDEILVYMKKNGISIAAIQETKLTSKSNFSSSQGDYIIIRQDRGNDGGGLAFIIENSVRYKSTTIPPPPSTDQTLEQHCISIYSGTTELKLVNIYIPPVSSCPSGYHANINHLLSLDNCIISGDINGHHSLWYSNLTADQRGEELADYINLSNYGILNEDTPTRRDKDLLSSPDITLASPEYLPITDWSTEIAMGSDHIPITIKINTSITKVGSNHKTYINFGKSDWNKFHEYTEKQFENLLPPDNVYFAEKTFRSILDKGRKLAFPAGRIPRIIPNFPSSAAKLADERDNLRRSDPCNPKISDLNIQISDLV